MSTISAILEPDSEGCLHLPVPEALLGHKVKVVASFEVAEPDGVHSAAADFNRASESAPIPVSAEAAQRLEAFRKLSASMAARGVDFKQWMSDIRESRR